MKWYVRTAFGVDFLAALCASVTALIVRFSGVLSAYTAPYVALSVALPFAWVFSLALARAYEPRIVGVGSDEFRRVLQAGFTLTATVAIAAYATKTDVARGYVVMALPLATTLNLAGRYWLRKYLHRLRADGRCMRRVVVVGHRAAVVDLLR